jgi:hypothetical protein
MLPFIVALVLAIGLPLLPSRLYHALHLPTLKFNFLSARYAPDDPLVSSRETTLLIEGSYSNEINPDSGGSSQYLVFPDISGPACSDDATAAASYLSLLGEQDYSPIIYLEIYPCSPLVPAGRSYGHHSSLVRRRCHIPSSSLPFYIRGTPLYCSLHLSAV